jgi:hypothetical protein
MTKIMAEMTAIGNIDSQDIVTPLHFHFFFFFFQSQNKRQIPNASNTKQLPRGSEARRPQRASERGSEGRKAVVMPIPKP